jgi:hypothetical protein
LRQAFWSIVLSLLLIALAAAATLPPRPFAVPLVAVGLGSGLWLTRRSWSRAHSGVAVSALGIAVRSGLDTAQIAWPALEAVLGVPHGKRMQIVVEARGVRYRTSATFTSDAALSWLATCADHASRRRLQPVPAEGLAGFRTA